MLELNNEKKKLAYEGQQKDLCIEVFGGFSTGEQTAFAFTK